MLVENSNQFQTKNSLMAALASSHALFSSVCVTSPSAIKSFISCQAKKDERDKYEFGALTFQNSSISDKASFSKAVSALKDGLQTSIASGSISIRKKLISLVQKD